MHSDVRFLCHTGFGGWHGWAHVRKLDVPTIFFGSKLISGISDASLPSSVGDDAFGFL